MPEAKEDKFATLMGWIRLLIPVIIAALGWYIGQTVGGFNKRLDVLEINAADRWEQFIEHRSKEETRIETIIHEHEKINSMIGRQEFEGLEKRVERQENKN